MSEWLASLKKLLQLDHLNAKSPDLDDEVLEWEEWRPGENTFLAHMIAGSIAGVTEHTAMYPIDTLKTHVQVLHCVFERQTSCSLRNRPSSSAIVAGKW